MPTLTSIAPELYSHICTFLPCARLADLEIHLHLSASCITLRDFYRYYLPSFWKNALRSMRYGLPLPGSFAWSKAGSSPPSWREHALALLADARKHSDVYDSSEVIHSCSQLSTPSVVHTPSSVRSANISLQLHPLFSYLHILTEGTKPAVICESAVIRLYGRRHYEDNLCEVPRALATFAFDPPVKEYTFLPVYRECDHEVWSPLPGKWTVVNEDGITMADVVEAVYALSVYAFHSMSQMLASIYFFGSSQSDFQIDPDVDRSELLYAYRIDENDRLECPYNWAHEISGSDFSDPKPGKTESVLLM